jgi:hypothetical protein
MLIRFDLLFYFFLLCIFFFRILTAREKRARKKFNSDIELQAYEKRLKDIEKKIRQLIKRGMCIE